ncbi:MAG: hypothetical protein AAGI30_02675 [Planctomycetota bacterium]
MQASPDMASDAKANSLSTLRVARLFESAGRSFRAMVGRNTGSPDSRPEIGIDSPEAEIDPAMIDPTPRERLVRSIQSFNPSASDEWLATFSDTALELYEQHLQAASRPRGQSARWVRPCDTPAVVGFACNVN